MIRLPLAPSPRWDFAVTAADVDGDVERKGSAAADDIAIVDEGDPWFS